MPTNQTGTNGENGINELYFDSMPTAYAEVLEYATRSAQGSSMYNPSIENKLKSEYIKKLTLEEAEKTIPWTQKVLTKNANVLKSFSNGVVVFEQTSLSRRTFDLFKTSLLLGVFKATHFYGSEIKKTTSNLNVSYEVTRTKTAISPKLDDDHVLVKNYDFYEVQEMFIDSGFKPSSITMSLTYDFDNVIEHTLDVPYTTDSSENFRKMQDVACTLQNVISERVNEIQRENRVPQRSPDTRTNKYRNKKIGTYISNEVPFSCEIECYGKSQLKTAQAVKLLSKEIGVAHDGSLTSDIGFPVEFQTPILQGKRGEILTAQTAETLVSSGFMVDKTCGLHIHLDGGDMVSKVRGTEQRPTEIIAMYLFYRIFEDVIESFLPSTRRNNRYASKFKCGASSGNGEVQHPQIDNFIGLLPALNTLDKFEMVWYGVPSVSSVYEAKNRRYTTSRYFGANFHSLLKDNHFEVRYHSGTLNYEKILYWVDLHSSILKACRTGKITESDMVNAYRRILDWSNIETITEMMFSFLDINDDTKEYLLDRQTKFKNVKDSTEILIDKTKKLGVI